MDIIPVPTHPSNYTYLLRDSSHTAVAAVDPGESDPVLEALHAHKWHLSHIILTHHHPDHIGGVAALTKETGARVIGANADRHRLPPLSLGVDEGDTIVFGAERAVVMALPGHTSGHIAFLLPQVKALFCGDVLFSLGCGRVFEGTMSTMWASLLRLRALPDDTRVYCAHEYTEANARFALSLEPDNGDLHAKMAEIAALRAQGQPTLPSTIGVERKLNPFLRCDDMAIKSRLGQPDATASDTFAVMRKMKDVFRG